LAILTFYYVFLQRCDVELSQENAIDEMLKHKFQVSFGIKVLDFHFSSKLATLTMFSKKFSIL